MKVTPELVEDIINDGAASAIEAVKIEKENLAAQMDLDLAGNKSGKLSTQIKMTIGVDIDTKKGNYEVTGSYGYSVPNLGRVGDALIRELPNPDQTEIIDGETGEPIGKNKE